MYKSYGGSLLHPTKRAGNNAYCFLTILPLLFSSCLRKKPKIFLQIKCASRIILILPTRDTQVSLLPLKPCCTVTKKLMRMMEWWETFHVWILCKVVQIKIVITFLDYSATLWSGLLHGTSGIIQKNITTTSLLNYQRRRLGVPSPWNTPFLFIWTRCF